MQTITIRVNEQTNSMIIKNEGPNNLEVKIFSKIEGLRVVHMETNWTLTLTYDRYILDNN